MPQHIHQTPTERTVRRRRHTPGDDMVPSPATLHRAVQAPAGAENIMALQRTLGNRAVQRLIQRDPETDGGTKKPPSKTLYMGMNSGAKGEAAHLKGILKDNVVTSLNDDKLEKTLETDEGIINWLTTETPLLNLNITKYLAAFNVIEQTTPAARDQMAQVVKMFYAAENGDFTMERIVLSGHSNGVELWGDVEKNFQPGKFMLNSDLQRLTSAFPVAAGQVEDVMFSACFTVSSIELVIKAFPNVRTVWGYAGFSPAAGKGAEQHIQQWEKSTRGEKTLEEKSGVGKAALWTRDAASASKDGKNGFVRNDPAKANVKDLIDAFYGMSINIVEQLHGEKAINSSTLTTAYGYVQMMLSHPELPDDQRVKAIVWRDTILRMRFYDKICTQFNSVYAADIKKGYAALGRKAPDFSKITRKGLALEMEAFKKALTEAEPPNAEAQAFYDKFLEGFWKLKPEIILTEWI